MYTRSYLKFSLIVCLGLGLVSPSLSSADQIGKDRFQEKIQIPQEPVQEKAVEQRKVVEEEKWSFDLSAGLNVLFFNHEDTHVAPGVFVDVSHSSVPLNFRVGVEGTVIDGKQDSLVAEAGPHGDTDLDFIRIPFTLEYIIPVAKSTNIYLGGGVDIISVSGVVSDTVAGGHLGARIRQGLTKSIALSVEGGYLWAEPDSDHHGSVDLNSAYVATMLSLALN